VLRFNLVVLGVYRVKETTKEKFVTNAIQIERVCRNPSLGLRPWQRELQGCGPKGSLGVKPKGSPGVKPKGSPGVKPKGSPGAKARESPGVKPRGSPGVTSHTPGSARKC